MIEAYYAGKALLGMPQDVDQQSNCYKIKTMKTGTCLISDITPEGIKKEIDYLTDPKNQIFENSDRVRRMMELEELHSHPVSWWADFGTKYGFEEI